MTPAEYIGPKGGWHKWSSVGARHIVGFLNLSLQDPGLVGDIMVVQERFSD